jgi:ABC-type glycerol-3-phosphate transport system substrate-binding protein
VVALAAVLSLGDGASEARPTSRSDAVEINMLALHTGQAGYELLIPNFERVYPNITVKITYNDPTQSWWNANVLLALQQDAIGLISGQSTTDSVLQAMDTAWQQGPS